MNYEEPYDRQLLSSHQLLRMPEGCGRLFQYVENPVLIARGQRANDRIHGEEKLPVSCNFKTDIDTFKIQWKRDAYPTRDKKFRRAKIGCIGQPGKPSSKIIARITRFEDLPTAYLIRAYWGTRTACDVQKQGDHVDGDWDRGELQKVLKRVSTFRRTIK